VSDKAVWFRPFEPAAFSITGDERDIAVIGELERSGGRYQREFSLFVRRTLAPDAVVVDGGAHIGVLTVLLATLCPTGRVYAFEPGPGSREHLLDNVAANHLDNVVVEDAALFDSDGEIVFAFDENYPAGSHVDADGSAVRSVRLDSWARARDLERLDLLKLDVEGSELAVLAGARETIRRFRPVAIVECNPAALRRFGARSYRDLADAMTPLFARIGTLDGSGAFVPLLSRAHLDLLLAERGVVDLVGVPELRGAEKARALMRSVLEYAKLARTFNRRRPAENKVVDPIVGFEAEADAIAGVAGTVVQVPLRITNRTRAWFSSTFPYHPVHVAYRVRDAHGATVVAEGHRTRFESPVAPGATAALDVAVALPESPGDYEVAITLVQEAFAWFDDLNPDCTLPLPARAT
jgi:FkbM family methyltransferase